MVKIIDVERIVTTRVAELAAATESKPSSTARNVANRNTATATLIIVSAVRRLLRRALFRIRPTNFIAFSSPDPPDLPDPPDAPRPTRPVSVQPACLFRDEADAMHARRRA